MIDKDDFIKLVGQRIRQIRQNKNMTIEELALEAELEYKQLSRIELGKINTSIYQIYKISDTLSVPLTEIFIPIYISE